MLTATERARRAPTSVAQTIAKERVQTRLEPAPTKAWLRTSRKSGFLPGSHFRNERSATILLVTNL
jgi:hypothetical protein